MPHQRIQTLSRWPALQLSRCRSPPSAGLIPTPIRTTVFRLHSTELNSLHSLPPLASKALDSPLAAQS
ncbi:unnamed protein product [Rhodiola kirilowii]